MRFDLSPVSFFSSKACVLTMPNKQCAGEDMRLDVTSSRESVEEVWQRLQSCMPSPEEGVSQGEEEEDRERQEKHRKDEKDPHTALQVSCCSYLFSDPCFCWCLTHRLFFPSPVQSYGVFQHLAQRVRKVLDKFVPPAAGDVLRCLKCVFLPLASPLMMPLLLHRQIIVCSLPLRNLPFDIDGIFYGGLRSISNQHAPYGSENDTLEHIRVAVSPPFLGFSSQ